MGSVADVDTVVAAADICLAPLAGGAGIKTKVLHYLAHGKRTVGTPAAFEGLSGAPGLFVASLEELPALVRRLCEEHEDQRTAEERARRQRTWLEDHHGRAHVRAQWEEVLQCLQTG